MPLPTVPNGWTGRGDLPDVEPRTASEEQLDALDEDLVQLVHSSGEFVLDVGWYPAASRSGRYICRAVIGQDWSAPLGELATQSRADVLQWLNDWYSRVADIFGEHGELSNEAVQLVLLTESIEPTIPMAEPLPSGPVMDAESTASMVRTRPARMPEYAS